MKSQYVSPAGFSLLELMIVLAIVSSVSIAVPPFVRWMENQGVGHAVEQIRADLQFTRMRAIAKKDRCALVFDATGAGNYFNTYNSHRIALTDYRGGVCFLESAPDGKKMAKKISFNRQGMSGSVVPKNIFLSNRARSAIYRIRVMLSGGVSVTRWNGRQWR